MANKVFKRYLSSDFTGIDGVQSSIENEGNAVNRAINYEMAVGNSLRGRVGCQIAGNPGYFFGIFPYNYTRTQDQYDITYDAGNTITGTRTAADGASIFKAIAINQQCWTLDTMNITVTQTNAGVYTWYSSVSGSNITFSIKKDGTLILTNSSLGDGVTTNTTIWDLLNTIDGLADLAVSRTTRGTCPPFAIVNGNQTTALVAGSTYGTTYSVTVANTPHNFYPGDIICFPQCTLSGGTLNGVTTMAAGIVKARTATLITYMGPKVTVTDGLVLGYMGQSAAGFPISTVSSETAGVFTLNIPYWRYIPEGPNTETYSGSGAIAIGSDYGLIFSEAMYLAQNRTSVSFFTPPNVQNIDNNLYIATSTRQTPYEAFLIANGLSSNYPQYQSLYDSLGVTNSLIKCDNQQLYRTGIYDPFSTAAPSVTAIAGATLSGTYKYKAFLRRYDAQGNIIEGLVSPVKTITYGAPNQTGSIELYNIGWPQYWGYGERSAWKVGNQASNIAGGFAIDDGAGAFPFFQPGDVCCFMSNAAQTAGLTIGAAGVLGVLHVTRCTFFDGTGANALIKVFDTSGVTINDNTPISSGLTMVLLRTTSGGNQFYQMAEVPIHSYGAITSFVLQDNVTDATLTTKAQYLEIPLGKEHNPPVRCSIVSSHQGGLVISRSFRNPNTTGFSSSDGTEYIPVASNYFDVPSTQSGAITAIASDTVNRLAIFKDKAYYEANGDLDAGTFTVNVKNEGDFGIASHTSLVRVNNALIGLSRNGFMVIQEGLLDPYKFKDVSARIINQAYQFNWANAVNDYFNRQYICSIPQVSGEPVSYVIDYSRGDIKVLERSYTTKIDQAGGMVMVGDTLYHLSQTSPYCVFRRLYRFNGDSPSGNGNGDSFIDNTGAISYVLESQPINFGEPGLLKTPIRVRIWSIANDYVIDGWVPFSALVESGATPIAAYVGSGGTNNTSSTVTFSTANDVYKDVKLQNQKTHFYIFRLTTNTIRTAPFITGYEIMFAENYEKEDFVK